MHGILALARKDLTLLLRNKGHLFFSFGWPLLVAVAFGFLFAGPGKGASAISIAVVDEDGSDGSKALLERLSRTDGLKPAPMARDAALDAVRRGRQVAAIVVPKGFGAASQRMFYGEPPSLQVAIDPSRRAESAMLEGMLMGAAMQGMQRLFTDSDYSKRVVDSALGDLKRPGASVEGAADISRFLGELRAFIDSPAARAQDPAATAPGQSPSAATGGWRPLVVEKAEVAVQRQGPPNAFMITFPQGVIWGVIGCAFGFALSLVIERSRGTLTRLYISPLSRRQVLAGKALACLVTILLVEALLFGVARALFDVVPASPGLLVIACASVAVAFVGIMMLISVLGRSEQTVGGIAWAILLPMSMLGGGMVPLFAMPAWMQAVSNVSPVKWGILAMEGALWRGFTPWEMLLPCGVLLAVGVAGFAVGARVFGSR